MKKILVALALVCLPVSIYAQGLPLKDGSASTLATIEDCGSSKNCLLHRGATNPTGVGLNALAGTTGASGSNATVGRVNRSYVGEDHGLQVASKYVYWDDTFNGTAQNTGKYQFAATTQTVTQAAGYLNINAAAGNAINTNSGMKTWRTFPIFGKSETRFNLSGYVTQVPQTNVTIEFGLFAADLTTRVVPTDGVFFRYNTLAEFRGIVSIGGVETPTAALTAPSANVNHDYNIVIQTNTVLFYVDDVLLGTISLLTDIPGSGQPMLAAEQNLVMREYIGASAPALAVTLKVSDVFVTSLGMDQQKPWSEQKAGFGHMAYQGQNGGTMGSTANYANSANPTAAVPTNTTAALGTGLGGQFWETVTLAANSDGIIQSFQNPTGSITQTPRNLIIYGVTYHCYNQVALATVAFNKQQSLAFGHTTVSLATAEGTSFTTNPTTKAPRRIALGVIQPVAAVNTSYVQYTIRFQAPIVVAPGEFIALVSKNVGTVPATGVIAWMIAYDGYFE
jgi:hypothetical protein